ncbi:hypothetical protein B7463_g9449, partial [Scytalidium lignicola]
MHSSFALVAAVMASSAAAAPYWNAGSNSNSTSTAVAGWATAPAAISSVAVSSVARGSDATATAVETGAAATSAATSAAITAAAGTTTAAAPPPANTGLDLTQQLFLADTAADRFALLPDNKDFVFNFDNPALFGKGGKGGDLIAANRKTFPALVGSGSGMAVGFLGPCGFNTPHVHLRGTELQIVVEGRIVTEMLPENGVNDANGKRRVITNTLHPFELTPFYQGSVHTQFNPDCTNTTFIAGFNNEDFGTGQVPDELFAFTDDVVSAAFGQAIDGAEVDKFRAAIPASIALGVEQCLKKCHISKR